MGKRLLFVIIIAFMLFGSVDYASCDGLYVEPAEFFSTYWMEYRDYPGKQSWVELDTLREAGGTWAQPCWPWTAIEKTPSGSVEEGIVHDYIYIDDNGNRAGLDLLSDQLTDLNDLGNGLGYRIALKIDPPFEISKWNSPWKAKVKTGDDDAQQVFYETMKKLAIDYNHLVDAWQIDQEPSDIVGGTYYSYQAYARLLKAGYSGIKDGYAEAGRDPSDAFVFSSYSIEQSWIKDVFEYQAETYGRVFLDGVSLHLFRSNGPENDQGNRSSGQFTGTMADAITLGHLYGRDHGISYPVDGRDTTPVGMLQSAYSTDTEDPDNGYGAAQVLTDENEQANYRARKAIIELTLGYVWSGWSRHSVEGTPNNDPDWYGYSIYWGGGGIIDREPRATPDNTYPPLKKKEAFWALNTIGGSIGSLDDGTSIRAGILAGKRFLSRLSLNDNTQHGYRFLGPGPDGLDGMVTAIWDADGTSQVKLETDETSLVLVKRGGEGDTNYPANGEITLNLSQSPQYIIGSVLEPNRAGIHQISNSGLPAPRLDKNIYVIDFQSEQDASGRSLKVTVPDGWTPPQTWNSATEGYTTVEPGPHVGASITASGNQIIVSLRTMPAGGTLRIYYGDARSYAMLLDPGHNGVVDVGEITNIAPPDHAYHKPGGRSLYNDFIGYGYTDNEYGSTWYNKDSPRTGIFADTGYRTETTEHRWGLKAKVNPWVDKYNVLVYLNSPDILNDDYLSGQGVLANGQTPDKKGNAAVFHNVVPQDGQIELELTSALNPKGKYTCGLYGVDIWPSGLGAGPGRNATLNDNRFIVKLDTIEVSPLSPDLTITVVEPTWSPPVVYLPMDEGGGTIAYDATDNHNNGTLSDAAIMWTTDSKVGDSALRFDVWSLTSVEIPPSESTNFTTELTVEAWVKNLSGGGQIVSRSEAFALTITDAQPYLFFMVSDGVDEYYVYSSEPVTPGEWSHIVGTFNQGVMKIYINGVESGSETISLNAIPADNTAPIYIGDGIENYSIIDEVKLYDTALTAGEIDREHQRFASLTAPDNLAASVLSTNQIDLTWQDNSDNEEGFRIERKIGADGIYVQIDSVKAGVESYSDTGLSPDITYYYRVVAYNAGGNSAYSYEYEGATTDSVSLPVAYWPMNNGDGFIAYDATANGNNGDINGAAWVTGKIGSSLSGLEFDGETAYVSVLDDDTLDISGSLTLEAWVNQAALNSWDKNRFIIAKPGAYAFGLAKGNPRLKLRITDPGGNDYWQIHTADVLVSKDQWHHLAATYNTGTNLVKIYVDGVEVYSGAQSRGIAVSSSDLYIAHDYDPETGKHRYFHGKIDEVKLYDTALTAGEIDYKYKTTR